MQGVLIRKQAKMKKVFLISLMFFCINISYPLKSFSCINSECKPCPDNFSIVSQCCSPDGSDCIILNDEIEDCGKGRWQEYPVSVAFQSYSKMECCDDATENNCRSIPNTNDYCGQGEFKKYPYSPIKKCCKDSTQSECVVIRPKGRCGQYQLKEYPTQTSKCCNSDLSECTRVKKIEECTRCM